MIQGQDCHHLRMSQVHPCRHLFSLQSAIKNMDPMEKLSCHRTQTGSSLSSYQRSLKRFCFFFLFLRKLSWGPRAQDWLLFCLWLSKKKKGCHGSVNKASIKMFWAGKEMTLISLDHNKVQKGRGWQKEKRNFRKMWHAVHHLNLSSAWALKGDFIFFSPKQRTKAPVCGTDFHCYEPFCSVDTKPSQAAELST